MKYYTEHFKEVEKRLELPQEAVELFEKTANKIEKSQSFSKRIDDSIKEFMYPEAHDFGGMEQSMKKIGFIHHVKYETLTFVWLIITSEIVLERYKQKGLSEELYWNTLMDLKYKFKECVDCKECYGTFVGSWYDGFYCLNRFALGRFQFEHSVYGGEDFTASNGITIKKGDKTIGFHIPSSGIPLTDDIRIDSYKKAYEFFKDDVRTDGILIFECGSWLLYDGNREILSENSNTVKFINDFQICQSKDKPKFYDAWRVFGKAGYGNPKKWPEDTAMRRAFKNHVLKGGKTGSGHGFVLFDGEKVIK